MRNAWRRRRLLASNRQRPQDGDGHHQIAKKLANRHIEHAGPKRKLQPPRRRHTAGRPQSAASSASRSWPPRFAQPDARTAVRGGRGCAVVFCRPPGQAARRRWCAMLQALLAPKPIHQLTRPPQRVASRGHKDGGPNSSGFRCSNPTTAGSEPMGSNVANTSATMNKALRPNWGSASQCKIS